MQINEFYSALVVDNHDVQDIIRKAYKDNSLKLKGDEYLYGTAFKDSLNAGYDHKMIVYQLEQYYKAEIIRLYVDFEKSIIVFDKPKVGREFYVDTPKGKLKVYAKHDTDTPEDFPGVFVDLVTPACPEGDMLACVEYNSSDGDLMTTVYQPGEDEPCEIVHHEIPNRARIETGPDGKLRYYDKNGTEILRGMKIRWDNGDVDVTYRADNDELGIDATNPSLVQKGKMNPCEMGIYPFTEEDLKEIEVF